MERSATIQNGILREDSRSKKERIDAIVTDCQAMALSSEINEGHRTDEEKKRLESLNKKATKLKKESSTHIPPNFIEELLTCVRPCSGSHPFLASEGSNTCSSCSSCICPACKVKLEEQTVCIQCHSDKFGVNSDMEDIQMIMNELVEEGIDLPPNTSVSEIQEIHKSCIVERRISMHKDLSQQVLFPVRLSDMFQQNSRRVGKHIMTVDLAHGGSLLNDTEK
eukprot:10304021-Ditylum_brightwellii.AAC.1